MRTFKLKPAFYLAENTPSYLLRNYSIIYLSHTHHMLDTVFFHISDFL